MQAKPAPHHHPSAEDAPSADKGRLFAAARAGHVAVLVGSTQRMGVGTNVQVRCVALHHLDCPWRPADIEQREGRALRQGNQNPEIGILRYVVEASFDAYSWQTVERKARFIAQIMRGRLDVREIEDIGDTALSFAEVKALASGDPLILDKAAADAEHTRLQRLERAHQRNRHALTSTLAAAQARADRSAHQLAQVQAALAIRQDTRAEAFVMTIASRRATTRPDAAWLIQEWTADAARAGLPHGRFQRPLGELGRLGGITIDAELRRSLTGTATLELTLRGVPAQPATLDLDRLGRDALSLVRQLEHRIADLPALAARLHAAQEAAAAEAARAQLALAQPFKQADALAAASARSQQIATRMRDRQQPTPDTEQAADAAAADTTAELQRVTRANFPALALGATASTATPARRAPPRPGRDADVSR